MNRIEPTNNPFVMRVVIVFRDGAVETHEIMVTGDGYGKLIRNRTDSSISSAKFFMFVNKEPYACSYTIESHTLITFKNK